MVVTVVVIMIAMMLLLHFFLSFTYKTYDPIMIPINFNVKVSFGKVLSKKKETLHLSNCALDHR